MALDVTYEFYTNTLQRSEITEDEFNRFVLANKLYVENLIDGGFIVERATDGYISAVCMMTETDCTGVTNELTSESIGGYSYAKEGKSVDSQKYEWLTAYCYITGGIR